MSTPDTVAIAELVKFFKDNEDKILSLMKSPAVDLAKKLLQRSMTTDSINDQFSSLDHSSVDPQLQLRYLFRLVTQVIEQDGRMLARFLSSLEDLREWEFIEYLEGISSEEKVSTEEDIATTDITLNVVCQSSCEIKVRDGKSTLLLVQASLKANVSYQWNKDGQPLHDGSSSYSGVHDDMLVISAHQGTGGEYTCIVRSQENEVSSSKVTVTVLYSPEKKTLLDMYSIWEEQVYGIWPPVGTQCFINLALIKSNGGLQGTAVERNTDDVWVQNRSIPYEEIFGAHKSSALILVEGCPGSGKTTFIHKIIKDWARGNMLVKTNLVFYVALQMLRNDSLDKGTSLYSMLQPFYRNERNIKAAIDDIERTNGEGVCFVLDELDQYSPCEKHNSLVFHMLNKTYLPRAMIIVLSRPGALIRLRQELVTHQIEVFGFTKDQIFRYIDAFPLHVLAESSISSTMLKEYLNLNPVVLRMCSLPLHAAIICFLFQQSKGHLSFTLTQIFEVLVRSVILYHLKRHNQDVRLYSLEEVDNITEGSFRQLCMFAYEMTINSKRVIDERDLSFRLGENTEKDWSLGLVGCSHMAQLSGFQKFYSFYHLAVQEFLAAYHVARNVEICWDRKRELEDILIREKKEWRSIFIEREEKFCSVENVIKSNFNNVRFFYFGLEDFEQMKLKFCHKMLKAVSDFEMESVVYAYESQQSIICDEVLERSKNKIKLRQIQLSNVPALVYLVSTSVRFYELALQLGSDSNLDIFLQQIQLVKFSSLETLDLQITMCNPEMLNNVLNLLESCRNLRYAYFKLGHLLSGELECFAQQWGHLLSSRVGVLAEEFEDVISLKALKLICLSTRDEKSPRILPVTHFLRHLAELKSLNISHWKMDVECSEVFASSLHYVVGLESLSLDDNCITSDGAIQLVSVLHRLTKLTKLDLSGNSIGTQGAISLASSLSNLASLQILNLTGNNIGSDGATGLSFELHHLVNLEHFLLSGNDIDACRAVQVIAALKDCPKLRCVTLTRHVTNCSCKDRPKSDSKSRAQKILIYDNWYEPYMDKDKDKDVDKNCDSFKVQIFVTMDDTATRESLDDAVKQHKQDAKIHL